MLISLENIQKYYKVGKEEIHVLKSLNLQIKSGEFVVIMGKSGSGKTTLLNILGFLDRFNEGRYLFDGKDVSNLNENQRSDFRNNNIGFIFQQFNFADEPTGALDSETSSDIMELLKTLNKRGKTVIMVTHDQDMIKYASKVIRLKDGVFISESEV